MSSVTGAICTTSLGNTKSILGPLNSNPGLPQPFGLAFDDSGNLFVGRQTKIEERWRRGEGDSEKLNHDVNRLNNLMGHTSPAMLWRHYHKAVTQKHAAAFWSIEPPKVNGKTIRFVAA